MAVERVNGEVVGVGNKVNETLPSVVKANVTVQDQKKQSGLKALWKGFFAEDLKTVRSNVVENVIKPSVKSGIANAITSAVYMWLFGKNGYSNGPGGIFRPLWTSNNQGYNYANQYRIQNGPVVAPGQSKISVTNSTGAPAMGIYTSANIYNPEYIRYGSFADAENVYLGLIDRISKYGVATVKNLMDLSGMSGYEMVLQNWGWYSIEWRRVLPAGDGISWILKLPEPCPLNSNKS